MGKRWIFHYERWGYVWGLFVCLCAPVAERMIVGELLINLFKIIFSHKWCRELPIVADLATILRATNAEMCELQDPDWLCTMSPSEDVDPGLLMTAMMVVGGLMALSSVDPLTINELQRRTRACQGLMGEF